MNLAEASKIELEISDVHSASDEYAARFSGKAGAWMLSIQERITLQLLAQYNNPSILDVGGGHGQLALPLINKGYPITVLGSSEDALLQLKKNAKPGSWTAQTGALLELPFADKSFDVVLCFRLIPHCEQWPRLIKELCRVAKKAVIADYPTKQSVNALAPALFGAKKKYEKNTRPFLLFSHAEIEEAFNKNGFKRTHNFKQFLFPLVLHRMLKNPAASGFLEGAAKLVGATALLGSPSIIEMRPEL